MGDNLKSIVTFLILSLLGILLIEPLFRSHLYIMSIDMIPKLQIWGNEFIDDFFICVSYFGSTKGIYLFYMILYLICNRVFFIKMIVPMFIVKLYVYFFKLLYHEQRPTMVSIRIHKKYDNFGNPSGHCLHIAGIYTTLWILCYLSKSLEKRKKIIKALFVPLLILIVLTCIARLYLA